MKTEQIYKEPQYKKFLERKREQSIVLNAERRKDDYRYSGSMHTLKDCQGILDEIQGVTNYKGKVIEGLVQIAEDELKEIRHKFENFKYKRVRAGYEEPLKPEGELLEQFCEAQARIDVLSEEISHLEKQINKLEKEQEKERADRQVLINGLKCAGKIESPMNPEIDGQKVNRCPDREVPYVDDTASKYDGMLIKDYRKLAKKWNKEMQQKDRERLKQKQDEAKAEGAEIPTMLIKTYRRRKYTQSELPDFPKEYENMKKVKT